MSRTEPPARAAAAPNNTPPATLASRLGFLLKHADQAYQAVQRPALAPFELDGRLLAALIVAASEGPALQQRLSERLQVDRTTMVALIDVLERSDLVERRRDRVDRRGYQVHVTTRGTTVLHKATDAIVAAERNFLAPLSAQERRQFRTLLGRLVLHGGLRRA